MSRNLKYMIVVEEGPSSFGAHAPDLPGCIAAGSTREEAIQLIQEAIELHLQDLKDQGRPIPEPSSSGEFVEVVAA